MFMFTRVISCSMHMIEFDLVTNPEQCRTHSVCPGLVRIKSCLVLSCIVTGQHSYGVKRSGLGLNANHTDQPSLPPPSGPIST